MSCDVASALYDVDAAYLRRRLGVGGDPTPSPDDLRLTATAIAAGRLLDVEVVDHVIVGANGFVSLRDRGVAFSSQR